MFQNKLVTDILEFKKLFHFISTFVHCLKSHENSIDWMYGLWKDEISKLFVTLLLLYQLELEKVHLSLLIGNSKRQIDQ